MNVDNDRAEWRFDTADGSYRRLLLPPRIGATVVKFRFPNAISPQALGRGADPRPLALALITATISDTSRASSG